MSTPLGTSRQTLVSISQSQTEGLHARIDRERKAALACHRDIKDFRSYALGQQRGTLTAAQQRILRGVTGRRFCDNVCKMVLLAAAGRLHVDRYSVDAKGAELAALTAYLSDFLTISQIRALANQVHWATLRDGNHCVALSWDNDAGRVRLARERWWDGKAGIFVQYDDLDQPVYAVKEWLAPEGLRRVVWTEGRIERFIADGGGWKPFRLDATNTDSWFALWQDSNNKPLGLPVVHFRNVYIANDDPETDVVSSYGLSELDGGVLGLQDEINDLQRDITAAGRYTGYQMLYGTGVTLEKDANNKAIPLKVEPGAVFTSESAAAKYGTLPAGDLSQLEAALHVKLQAISRMTATPLHEITGGDWPSGEALLRADQPLKDKADAIVEVFGPAWASLAHKATMLANAFGGQSLNTDAMITTVFQPTDKSDPLTRAQVATAEAPYVSDEETLRTLGKSPDQIKQIMEERAANTAAQVTQIRARQDAFLAGTDVQPNGASSNGTAGSGTGTGAAANANNTNGRNPNSPQQ